MVESYVRQPIQISSSDELRWKQYARAYALACIGSFLLADRSGAAVHPVYLLLLEQGHGKAWGDIGGWMVLLQACALEHFPSIA
ncbi:hypothetical protein LINGRAHAP2_LOCUS8221 [Linum grandiflorum]